ncbi:RNA recognition motif-containing protein [Phlyctochytrium planicorne]|nr:RNA recognition motif-containing protein [Phlyctochytrium planicorne]
MDDIVEEGGEDVVADENDASEDVSEELKPKKDKKSGKPKDESVHAKSTLFVRGIPFEATSAALEEFFSAVGPVRSCFVVAAGAEESTKADTVGAKVNKGYGFVTFSIPEDAERALTDLKTVQFLGKRKLQMELALKKNAPRESVKSSKPPTAKKNPHPSSIPKVPYERPSKSVKITGIKSDVNKKQLNHKLKKMGTIVELNFPVENDSEAIEGKFTAIVQFRSPQEATYAVTKLNDHVFKGEKIKAILQKAEITVADPEREARKIRLIIRNLSFNCDESHLRKAFEAHGTVKEVVIPLKPDGKKRGFGFVQMSKLEEAETAMNKVNGTKIQGREVAVDWALPKDTYELSKQDLASQEADGKDGNVEMADSDKEEGEEDGEEEAGDDGEEEEEEEEEQDDEEDEEEDGQEYALEGFRNNVDEGEEGDDMENDDDDDDDDDDVEVTFDEDDEYEEVGLKDKPRRKENDTSDVEKRSTIFIRNLSFDTTQEELVERFSTFGNLKYGVITKDHITGRSRGTGFVNFADPEDARKCMAQYKEAERAGLFDDGNHDEKEKDKKKKAKKSVLTPDHSITAGSSFFLGGRFLNLAIAVTRDDATKFAEENSAKRRANDKRHMYLLKEGMIYEKSDAAIGVPPLDLSKRQRSLTERKRLLDTNPSLFISRTRLSVRNLVTKVTDAGLKRAAILSVKRFWDEVKEGSRKTLEKEVFDEEVEEGREKPGPDRQIKLVQVKILKDKEHLDSKTGKPSSKGFGFIEFESHADALACLRWLNNNPLAFDAEGRPLSGEEVKAGLRAAAKDGSEQLTFNKGQKRPIVEFAIENRLVLKKRAEREAREKQKKENEAAQAEAEGEVKEKKQRKRRERPEKAEKAAKVDAMEMEETNDSKSKSKSKKASESVEADDEETVEPPLKRQKKDKKQEKPTKALEDDDDDGDDEDFSAFIDLKGTMAKLEQLIETEEAEEKDNKSGTGKQKPKAGKSAEQNGTKKASTVSDAPAKAVKPQLSKSEKTLKQPKSTPSKQEQQHTKPTAAPSKSEQKEAKPSKAISKDGGKRLRDSVEAAEPDRPEPKQKKQKPLSKAELRDEKDEENFIGLLKKYGKDFFGGEGSSSVEKKGKEASFKKWYM